jgi:preprotein translocase subunit SecG
MQSLLTPILLAIHVMLALALIGVVLLQRSEGGLGGLGGGGMSGLMTSRGSANLLSKTTRWLAGAFMATSLSMAWLASQSHTTAPLVVPESLPSEVPVAPIQDQTETDVPAGSEQSAPSGSEGAAGAAPGVPAVPTNQ